MIDKELSPAFKKYVENDRFMYRLKDGFELETVVLKLKNGAIRVIDCLEKNRKLINYLINFDFSEVVEKKKEIFGLIYEDDESLKFLSKKEKEIFISLCLVLKK